MSAYLQIFRSSVVCLRNKQAGRQLEPGPVHVGSDLFLFRHHYNYHLLLPCLPLLWRRGKRRYSIERFDNQRVICLVCYLLMITQMVCQLIFLPTCVTIAQDYSTGVSANVASACHNAWCVICSGLLTDLSADVASACHDVWCVICS